MNEVAAFFAVTGALTYVGAAAVIAAATVFSAVLVCGTYMHVFNIQNKQKEEAYKQLQDALNKYSSGQPSLPSILNFPSTPTKGNKAC